MSKSLRVIFAGTADFSAYILNEIFYKSNHKIVGILTKSDKPVGRGKLIQFSLVKKISEEKKIPVFQPTTIFTERDFENLKLLNPDLLIVVSYGLIIPNECLSIPKFGCINVHLSLLPRWRGAAPVQRTLLAGDRKTGITIIQMNEQLDAGDILYQKSCTVSKTETSASLYKKLSYIGSNAVLFLLNEIACGKRIVQKSQDSNMVTYAKKIKKSEAKLNWNLSAMILDRYVRAFNPWPISYFILKNKIVVKVWSSFYEKKNQISNFEPGTILRSDRFGISVSTAKGNLVLTSLQLPGRKKISVSEMLNAKKEWFKIGNKLH